MISPLAYIRRWLDARAEARERKRKAQLRSDLVAMSIVNTENRSSLR